MPLVLLSTAAGLPAARKYFTPAAFHRTYFLAAESLSSAATGTYKISANILSTTLADDYAASTATTGSIAVGGSTTAALRPPAMWTGSRSR